MDESSKKLGRLKQSICVHICFIIKINNKFLRIISAGGLLIRWSHKIESKGQKYLF